MDSYIEIIDIYLDNEDIEYGKLCKDRKELYKSFFHFLDKISVKINEMIRKDETLRKVSVDVIDNVDYYMRTSLKHASHIWFKKFSDLLEISNIEIGFMKSFRDEFIKNIKVA